MSKPQCEELDRLKKAIMNAVKRGATEYVVSGTDRRLVYPDGRIALQLPCEQDNGNAAAEFALEQLAWHEYHQAKGRIVLVNRLSGYTQNDSCDVYCTPPVRVRVRRDARAGDICRWMDGGHLDPVWDVDLIDKGDSALSGMRSFWLYATSRSLAGGIERSDVVAIESPLSRLAGLLGFRPRLANAA